MLHCDYIRYVLLCIAVVQGVHSNYRGRCNINLFVFAHTLHKGIWLQPKMNLVIENFPKKGG